MKAKGPTAERETIVRWADDSDKVTIWTASNAAYRKLRKLGFKLIAEGERHAEFECTTTNVTLRKAPTLSETQRRAMAERARLLRQKTTIVVPPEQKRAVPEE